jgi:hypothetical protein
MAHSGRITGAARSRPEHGAAPRSCPLDKTVGLSGCVAVNTVMDLGYFRIQSVGDGFDR